MTNPVALKTGLVEIDSIDVHPENPRRGDLDAIKTSLQTYPQYAPIVVQKSTGRVLVGNHRLIAARSLGWTKINATYVDVDDDGAMKLLLADNRTSDKGTYDEAALLATLRGLSDLSGSGYAPTDLDELARVTGELAATNTGFLDGLEDDHDGDDPDEEPEGDDRQFVQLQYPMRPSDRKIVLDGLKLAKADFGVETAVEALILMVQNYVAERES